ncbi:MAG: hypothetical protein MUP85_02560 [Candidatus Lokiarchaeota archaeon]|nr:hypothetical protein [Candidatus Lokiarchaeota archaeon]
MFNQEDKEEQEIQAIKLIDQAEVLADRGKGEEAIKIYEEAAQIYLDLGSYIKLDELFIRITSIILQFKNNIQATYRLKSIIRKTEELKLYEISAKLLINLGNISFKMNDWETAGESWSQASDYLYESDPEEFLNLVSILLLKAGQSYERASQTRELGKQLIFKAVMRHNKFFEQYKEEEKQGQLLIANKDFEAASKKFHDVSSYFKKSLDNLSDLLNEEEDKDTMLNAKARFIHFIAEYQTISAICLSASNIPEHNEKIKTVGMDSIELFKESISLFKNYLFPKKKEFDKEIVLRVTFDTMLLAIIQRILEIEEIKCTENLLSGIESNKALIKTIKKSPYFQITKEIEEVGLTDTLENIRKVNLGHFESIKNTLVSHFLEQNRL